MRHAAISLLVLALMSGCAAVERRGCTAAETANVSEMIYFGMAKPTGGTVSPQEWTEFLRTVVTPRFPSGLTAWPASGQWRGADGQVVREDSYVLNLLHPPDAAAESAIQAIVAEYKKRFTQEAVLRVRSSACVSF